MAWKYSKKTTDLFMDAVQGKAGTHLGELDEPDGFGEHGSIACGDALRFAFRVERADDPHDDRIVEARYLTFGCTSAIAASEALCALIEDGDYTPISALAITNKDIVKYLDGLPPEKIHCSVMGAEALEAAVFDWAQRRQVSLHDLGIDIKPHEEEEGRLVCKCFGLTEPYIRRKIKELSLRSIPEITGAIKAGGACESCHHASGGLQDLLDEAWGRKPLSAGKELPIFSQSPVSTPTSAHQAGESVLSPYQFAKKVEQIVDEEVRPILLADGGDLEIVDIKGTRIYTRMTGACSACHASTNTLHNLVEKALKEGLDDGIRVIAVS